MSDYFELKSQVVESFFDSNLKSQTPTENTWEQGL